MHIMSIIIPVYFNEGSLNILFDRLNRLSVALKEVQFELIFVDDDSQDKSLDILQELARQDKRVKIVKLSRNFGSIVACLAGLTYAIGDCAVIMAADLQDPPELIVELFNKWKQGSEVVFAVREKREERWMKTFLSNLYYQLFRFMALKKMPKKGFDFVLIGRKVIDVIVNSKEKNSTLVGQILWAGFKTDQIYYTKQARKHGHSRWTFWKKIKYSIDSIMAFSYFPIRIASVLGILVALLGFIFAVYAAVRKIIFGVNVPGFTLLLVILLLTAGVQMILLGIIGEYLWRALDESRKRPIFIVENTIGFDKEKVNRKKD